MARRINAIARFCRVQILYKTAEIDAIHEMCENGPAVTYRL